MDIVVYISFHSAMIDDAVMGVTVKFDGATDGTVKEISMPFFFKR